jgi:hypothetical protein
LVLGRRTELPEVAPLTRRRWLNRALVVLRTVVVVAFVGLALKGAHDRRKAFGDLAPRPPLYGLWEVEEFEADGHVHPPLTTDAARWAHVSFSRQSSLGARLVITTMKGGRRFYGVEVDPRRHTITLTRQAMTPDGQAPPGKIEFTYREAGPDLVTLEGTLDGRRICARLRRVDESEFLLVNRGFHWINEFPFNRAEPRGGRREY